MDYSAVLEQLENYFCDLLIIQYRQAPKNRSFIKLLVDLIFANNLGLQIQDLTVNLEQSEGLQLDVVGAWLGVDRLYSGLIFDHNYFTLFTYNHLKTSSFLTGQGGFYNYTNFDEDNGGFLTYKVWKDTYTTVNKLGDDLFRKLLYLKAIKNSIDFNCKDIDNAIYTWSSGEAYTTWDTMKVTYNYKTSLSQLMQIAKTKNVLLAPTGCQIELREVN